MAGRHVADPLPPTRTGRAVTAATVAAAGVVTGPLALSATTAEATPIAVDWNRLAQCEASGNWAANSGNGFSGGLQFTQSTWQAFGGLQYASHAFQATEAQQIAVAKKVLAGQGIHAWPVCGPGALLKIGGSDAGTGVSVTPAAAPARSSQGPTLVEGSVVRKAPVVKAAAVVPRPAPTTGQKLPARKPEQPPAARAAAAVPEPTNPACVALKRAGVPVGQLDAIWHARPELGLDGNGNGVPCDTTYPRGIPRSVPSGGSPVAVKVAPAAAKAPAAPKVAARVQTAANTTTADPVAAKRAAILATARSWLGVKYLYGGASRAGVDCSGLVQQVMRANGINLPRTAEAQYAASTHITRAQLQPGDLVFSTSAEGTHHVGVFIGNGQQIDAQQDGVPVAIHALYPDETLAGRVV